MTEYNQPMQEGRYYHIYNQGNNGENIFLSTENHEYFIRKLDFYLSDFIEVYSFCLLPNHFHFLISIKDWSDIEPKLINHKGLIELVKGKNDKAEIITSEMFRRFFMSYSKAFNKQNERSGSLFRKSLKRKLIDSNEYFQNTVIYIHQNSRNHGIFNDFENYPWNSYQRILNDQPSKLKKAEVLNTFHDRDNFIFSHQREVKIEFE